MRKDQVMNENRNVSGYWIGEATGTNKAGFALNLTHVGKEISGTAKVFESSIGVCECSVSGKITGDVDVQLLIKSVQGNLNIGNVEVTAQLVDLNQITGRWTSEIGVEGVLTMNRYDPEKAKAELPKSNSVFLVHGHDEGSKHAVARFLEKLGVEPVILQEQINRGMTVIEKFEDFASRAGYAIVLLTPDDYGYLKGEQEKKRHRARQNVILELGYFAAKLGRNRLMVLTMGDVEIPSDILGLVYETLDRGEGWKMRLANELKGAGYDIDLNKVA